jgi:hypothetical protein
MTGDHLDHAGFFEIVLGRRPAALCVPIETRDQLVDLSVEDVVRIQISVIIIDHIKFLEHARNAPLRSIAAQCLFTALILAFACRVTAWSRKAPLCLRTTWSGWLGSELRSPIQLLRGDLFPQNYLPQITFFEPFAQCHQNGGGRINRRPPAPCLPVLPSDVNQLIAKESMAIGRSRGPQKPRLWRRAGNPQ